MKKTILILDGQGGGVGRSIAERLIKEVPDALFIAVGTNTAATSSMMKAGITVAGTGENAWIYNCTRADIIVGPIGIILANAMNGEISAQMATAVTTSPAQRLILPVANHHLLIAGLPVLTLQEYLDKLAGEIKNML